MAYTEPPNVQAGDTWTAEDFQKYVLDNIIALNDSIGGGGGTTFDTDDVVTGSGTGLEATQVQKGGIVYGTGTDIAVLAPGRTGQVLESDGSGNLSYESPVALDSVFYRAVLGDI